MLNFTLDKIDIEILMALQLDAGISNLELADKISLSPSPCSRRVKLLENAGFFRGRVTLLDPKAVGLPVNVFIQITLNRQEKKNLENFENNISQFSEVMECYLMAGDFDYLIRVAVPDLISYQIFLDKITDMEGISLIKSSFSLKQICYKTELPLKHLSIV
ncbi:Lrp/AsnC family transcriptional regulator [Colwellia sp. MB3u-70]|uniref:Lrp/AsnC family transcriptional regulator n=1 Tax=unclassified Colwellia TaxID=196834 RepID=UPI0015F45493|nr:MULTISPECIES: Lrp/AsnC family transcriptional regulator [unclassified Colwellia]MBA6292750.1 Lrp/AsnC family transcriptional regulator [Colwellia sp. MB3u-8]MBA6308778.1 Lrp/AsnC family transcriptional regulator [Colwellia sp. MB3u-70]